MASFKSKKRRGLMFKSKEEKREDVIERVEDYGEDIEVADEKVASPKKKNLSTKEKSKPKETTKKGTKTKPFSDSVDSRNNYDGIVEIKVYGNVVFELKTKEEKKLSNEDIRVQLVEHYGFREFDKDVTLFRFNATTGVLNVGAKLERKG